MVDRSDAAGDEGAKWLLGADGMYFFRPLADFHGILDLHTNLRLWTEILREILNHDSGSIFLINTFTLNLPQNLRFELRFHDRGNTTSRPLVAGARRARVTRAARPNA